MGGNTLSTKMKMAFSALSLILFRITYTNWPTVRSAGTRYLKFSACNSYEKKRRNKLIEIFECSFENKNQMNVQLLIQKNMQQKEIQCIEESYFFLSMSGISVLSAFSTITYSTIGDLIIRILLQLHATKL